jgi:signal transduction histidine kinase
MRLIEAEAGGIGAFARELHGTLSDALQSIDLLLDDSVGTLNPMQRNLLDSMKASTARLHGVIQDFVQVRTFKANSEAPVELSSVVQDAIAETGSPIRAKRITLNVHQPENLGSIHADREALQQILIRLISNAGAASPLQGTVQLHIETKVKDGKEYLLIKVTDTGGGIPREDLQRVFTPLYRADDIPARGVGEPGMGLFIAKTLTEAQDGRIWVDTEPGVGSTYNVLIPVHREKPVHMSAGEQNHEGE